MVEIFKVVSLNFMLEKRSEGGDAMLPNAAAGDVGGKAGKEVGNAFIFWAFGGKPLLIGGRVRATQKSILIYPEMA